MNKEATVFLEFENQNKHALTSNTLYLLGRKGLECELKSMLELEDESVDEKHAILEVCNKQIYVIDIYSRKGTYINDNLIEPMQKVKINQMSNVRFGNVAAKIYFNDVQIEGDAEESLNSSAVHDGLKNTSDIILSSPESLLQSIKSHMKLLKNRNILNSTTDADSQQETTAIANIDSVCSNISASGRNSTRDSFSIPETQYVPTNEVAKYVKAESIAKTDCTVGNVSHTSNDDSFIPETQEVLKTNCNTQHCKMLQIPTENSHNIDESQFRICTQDYNEDVFDTNEDQLFHDIAQCSLVTPHIQYTPPLLNTNESLRNKSNDPTKGNQDISKDDLELCALNWSATTSVSTTLNESHICDGEEVNCAGTCTPDIFELPIIAQNKAKTIVAETGEEDKNKLLKIVTSEGFVVPQAVKPISKTTSIAQNEDDDDLLPTQVFTANAESSNDNHLQQQQQGKAKQQPSACIATEKFNNVDGSNTEMPSNRDRIGREQNNNQYKKEIFNINNDNNFDHECDDDDLVPTQVFTLKKTDKSLARPSNISANINSSQTTNNGNTEIAIIVDSIFKDIEDFSSQNEQHAERKDKGFKHPTAVSVSASNQNSFLGSQNAEVEELMCTPQLLKEKFTACVAQAKEKQTKQKKLLSNDSEEEDVLNLINAPKISNDFDLLLSNLGTNYEDDSTKKSQTAGSNRKHSFYIFSDNDSNSKETDKHRNRDERHEAYSKAQADAVTASGKQEKRKSVVQSDTKTTRSNKTNDKVEKKVNIDAQPNSRPKAKAKTRSSSQEKLKEGDKCEENTIAKRVTRLRSRCEESSDTNNKKPVENHVKLKNKETKGEKTTSAHIKESHLPSAEVHKKSLLQETKETKRKEAKSTKLTSKSALEKPASTAIPEKVDNVVTVRRTRSRSNTESQESTVSSATTGSSTKKELNERKRKGQIDANIANKRERTMSTTSSSGASGSGSITNAIKLKVSMTMVDPELFQKLADNSSDLWTIAKDPIESDILVMDKGNRTYKFLIAMAKGIPIVTSKWLECVNTTKKIANRPEHFFMDVNFEKRHKFTLLKSLKTACKQKLFTDYEFLITSNVLPNPSELKAIITCAGGKVHTVTPPPKDNQKLYLISSANDKRHWHKYRRINNNIHIISTEGIMTSIMRQQVQPLEKHLLT